MNPNRSSFQAILNTCIFLIFVTAIPPARSQSRDSIAQNYGKDEYMLPMRDGVKLFTSVYVPKDTTTKYPIMLNRTPYSVAPYGKDAYKRVLGPSMLFTRERFIFVYQDVRGRFMSEGEFVNMTPYIPNKNSKSDVDASSDTYDTIEWLLKNISNHNGRVGIWGISYPGFFAAMATIDAHPALVAVSPQAPIADWFIGDDMHHHGAFSLSLAFNFFATFGKPRPGPIKAWPPKPNFSTSDAFTFFLEMGPLANANEKYLKEEIVFWNEMMKHGTYDDFWQSRNTLPHFNEITPAVMTVGGWYDGEDLYGTLRTYQSIEEKNPDAYNILVIGPWSHGGWARSDGQAFGDMQFGAKTSEYYRENIELQFFNYYLKGEGKLNLPDVYAFETGANKWHAYDQWPPKAAHKKTFYFNSSQTLSLIKPKESGLNLFEEYVSHPDHPVPYTANRSRLNSLYYKSYMAEDQSFAASRPDVLVYATKPLSEEVTLAGPITAELYVSTSGTDSDWVVKLIDVFPEDAADSDSILGSNDMAGYQMLVRGEVLRGKFRNSYENPQPFHANEVTKVEIVLQDSHHTFLQAHKIMVQVQSSWFPLFDRNPQKFVDIYSAQEDDFQKATQRVYRSQEYPSNIKLTILE